VKVDEVAKLGNAVQEKLSNKELLRQNWNEIWTGLTFSGVRSLTHTKMRKSNCLTDDLSFGEHPCTDWVAPHIFVLPFIVWQYGSVNFENFTGNSPTKTLDFTIFSSNQFLVIFLKDSLYIKTQFSKRSREYLEILSQIWCPLWSLIINLRVFDEHIRNLALHEIGFPFRFADNII